MDYYPLARKVLAVAVKGDVDDWAAYIDCVSGENHRIEAEKVAKHGTKLPENIGRLLFPRFKHLRWRH